MARHLATVTNAEWADLHHRLVAWLKKHNVAGSVAQDYSLYRALDEERDKAIHPPAWEDDDLPDPVVPDEDETR